jgi:NADPH-dependent curcumin reductase CurA
VKDTMSLDKQQHVSAPAAGPVSHRRLQVLVDDSIKGLSAIPDAIEYMLRGGHIGKVVVDLRKP